MGRRPARPGPGRAGVPRRDGAKTNRARTRGYAPRGERRVEAVPHGHGHTTTFVGALRADGMVAPVVVDGAADGGLFRAYVGQVLVPELRPGGVVVLDDLGGHPVGGVREAVERAGCRPLSLPPYTPDYNPIENAFSELEGLLRKAAGRTVEGLWAAIGRMLDQFRPDECRNDLRHCGYAATPP